MRGTLPSLRALCAIPAAALVLSACGGEPSVDGLREWQPSDHQLPEGYREAEQAEAPPADPGAALYASYCARCHGPRGRGDGPGRPPMARMPSFADATFHAARTDTQLADAITNGRGGFMPAFADRVSPAGVAALVRTVRSFAPTPAPAVEPTPEGAAPAEPAPSP
jgi:mono/diheme cytochrome c family protein